MPTWLALDRRRRLEIGIEHGWAGCSMMGIDGVWASRPWWALLISGQQWLGIVVVFVFAGMLIDDEMVEIEIEAVMAVGGKAEERAGRGFD
ncbi:hypothetical protein M0R45_034392 [Rubus argutus]|uniref:Uncharacterized protein n=1 Tax=Rubus argutus TaxID=59490 RepID=A0AAW1VRT5_RUBAR